MGVYSVLLGQQHVSADGTVVLYTVPSAATVVVRDICIYLDADAPYVLGSTVGVAVQTGEEEPVYVAIQFEPGTAATYHWDGRQVLNPGDVLLAVSVGVSFACRVSGYLLGA